MRANFNAVRLTDPRQTAKEMVRLCTVYAGDLGNLARLPLPRYFDLVRKLPYKADPKNAETLSRPKFLLEKDYSFRDCDDKAILMGSWLYLNKIPFGFYASSVKPNRQLHHVWTVARLNGRDIVLDPTYRHHKFGELPKRDQITRIQKLIEVPAVQLHTYEGYGAEQLGFLKKVKKAAKKVKNVATKQVKNQVKKTTKAVKQTATQLKRGNILKAAETAAKPIPGATTAVKTTYKVGTQLKRGNVLKAAKITGSAAVKSGNLVADIIGRSMPAVIKNAIKAAVRKVAGDKVTLATKAVILPSATAAAMAVPGAQPYAAYVPVVVNLALDEIIEAAKKKAVRNVKTVVRENVSNAKKQVRNIAKPATTGAETVQTNVDPLAQQKAAALKAKIAEARAKQAAETVQTNVDPLAQQKAAALKAKIAEARAKTEFNKNLILPIAAAAIGAGLLLKGRRG